MAQIDIKNVFFSYPQGVEALSDVSLQIEKGESIAVIGRNGAGKTTLVKLINGLLKPKKGSISIDGEDTAKMTAAMLSHSVSYAFQNPDDQIFKQTVFGEIAFGPKRAGMTGKTLEACVQDAAERCMLRNLLNNNPYDLSLAERKFVTIASVLARNTEIVILDEPTAGQDKRGIDCLSEIIGSLNSLEKTVITITHDMEFVSENFKRLIVMSEGKKLADQETGKVFWNKDVMEKAGLKQPYICSLSQKLGIEKEITTISDFISFIEFQRNERGEKQYDGR